MRKLPRLWKAEAAKRGKSLSKTLDLRTEVMIYRKLGSEGLEPLDLTMRDWTEEADWLAEELDIPVGRLRRRLSTYREFLPLACATSTYLPPFTDTEWEESGGVSDLYSTGSASDSDTVGPLAFRAQHRGHPRDFLRFIEGLAKDNNDPNPFDMVQHQTDDAGELVASEERHVSDHKPDENDAAEPDAEVNRRQFDEINSNSGPAQVRGPTSPDFNVPPPVIDDAIAPIWDLTGVASDTEEEHAVVDLTGSVSDSSVQ